MKQVLYTMWLGLRDCIISLLVLSLIATITFAPLLLASTYGVGWLLIYTPIALVFLYALGGERL